MNEKTHKQYGVKFNPPSETMAPLPVPLAERVRNKGYHRVLIEDQEFDIVDKKVIELLTEQIQRLERDLKKANARISQLTNSLHSTIKDQEDNTRRLDKITRP